MMRYNKSVKTIKISESATDDDDEKL